MPSEVLDSESIETYKSWRSSLSVSKEKSRSILMEEVNNSDKASSACKELIRDRLQIDMCKVCSFA